MTSEDFPRVRYRQNGYDADGGTFAETSENLLLLVLIETCSVLGD